MNNLIVIEWKDENSNWHWQEYLHGPEWSDDFMKPIIDKEDVNYFDFFWKDIKLL